MTSGWPPASVARRGKAWLAVVDSWQQRRAWSAVPVAVLLRSRFHQGVQWAVLVSYYGFLSLLPALLVLVTGLGYLLSGNPSMQQAILNTAVANFPVLGQQLRSDVTSLTGSLPIVVFGVVWALYASGAVLRTAHDALDVIAGTPTPARAGYLLTNARLAVVGAVGLLATVLAAAAGGLTSGARSLPGGVRVASLTISVLMGMLVLAVAFRFLASDRPPWRSVLPGAVAGTIGWAVLHAVGGIYLNRVVGPASLTYGAMAIVVGLLAWLYLQARVFLLAAELNVVLAARLWPRSFRQ